MIRKDKKIKEKYLDFLNKVTDVDVEKLSHLPAHLGPAGNFMESPGDGNVLLVGDAAGFADSLTGEGIYYAHKSAECATNAIVDYFESGEKNVLLESYKSYLAPTIRELKISLRFRNLVYSNLRKIGFFIFRSPGIYSKLSAIVHGTKSYTQLPFISKW
jgi:flavin-dependent dehydrogenase